MQIATHYTLQIEAIETHTNYMSYSNYAGSMVHTVSGGPAECWNPANQQHQPPETRLLVATHRANGPANKRVFISLNYVPVPLFIVLLLVRVWESAGRRRR